MAVQSTKLRMPNCLRLSSLQGHCIHEPRLALHKEEMHQKRRDGQQLQDGCQSRFIGVGGWCSCVGRLAFPSVCAAFHRIRTPPQPHGRRRRKPYYTSSVDHRNAHYWSLASFGKHFQHAQTTVPPEVRGRCVLVWVFEYLNVKFETKRGKSG